MTAFTAAGGLHFTPLYGAQSDAEPLACLLRVGSATVLLDCGWDERFDVQLLQPLLSVLPQINLVLLSQPDAAHVGALPYLTGRASLAAPVYATSPIARLAPMFMYDLYTSVQAVSEFDLFGPEDIDAAFDRIVTLKHHQPVTLEAGGQRLVIEALPAGHSVGGAIWTVEVGGEVLAYAPHSNHMKERCLNAGQLSRLPVRPALMVVGAARGAAAGFSGSKRRDTRDAALEEALRQVFRAGGSAILPVDCAGRMLEVLLVLEQMWQRQSFPYTLALLSAVADSTLLAAASMLEWMSDELLKDFNRDFSNPFRIDGREERRQKGRMSVVRCHSLADVARLPGSSKVVIATGASLDVGLARELLLSWGADGRNAVIFTQLPRPGSLGSQLLSAGAGRPLLLQLTRAHREPLRGAELEAYEAKQAAAAEAAEAAAEAAAAEAAAAAVAAGAPDGAAAAAAHAALLRPGGASALLPLRESTEAISQLKRGATGSLEQVLVGAGGDDSLDDGGLLDTHVLMDGFVPPPSALYCMFPDEQEQVTQEWDAFGAVVDTQPLAVDEEAADMLGSLLEDADAQDDADDAPTKVVSEVVHLPLAASVAYVDGFAGLSDARSLATIVEAVAPRALLLVGASAPDTAHLADTCRAVLRDRLDSQTRLLQPASGQEVTLRLASSARVVVSPQLLAGLTLHSLNNNTYHVSWLDGVLAAPPPSDAAGGADSDAANTAAGAGGAATPAAAAEPGGGKGAPEQHKQQQDQQQKDQQPRPRAPLEEQERLLVLMPAGAAAAEGAGHDGDADAGDADGAGAWTAMDTSDHAGSQQQAAGGGSDAAAVAAANGGGGAAAAASLESSEAATEAAAAAAASQAAAAAAVDAAEAAAEAAVGDHGGIFIGDVQLSEVKAALSRAGVQCEFRPGSRALHAGPLVVRRDGPGGQLLLEGPMCADYYTVRQVVYGLYELC